MKLTQFKCQFLLTGFLLLSGLWASAQTVTPQVTVSYTQGNKVFLDIDGQALQLAIDNLYEATANSSSMTLSQVLANGGDPGAHMSFYNYDITNVGNVGASGTLMADSLILYKDAVIAGRLTVSGVTSLSDSLIVGGFAEFADSLEVVKAVTIGQTLFVTGVTSLGDSLHVAGNVDLDALFNVDGAATFGSTIQVAGDADLNGALDVNGNATIGGTLGATGETTLGDTLHVNAPGLFSDSLHVAGGAAFGDDLSVTGNSSVGGNSSVTGMLNVTGAATLSDDLTVNGETTMKDTLHVDAPGLFSDSLHVAGGADFDSNVNVDGNATVGGTLSVTGATTLSDDLTVTGETTLGDTLHVNAPGLFSDSLHVAGGAAFGDDVTITGNSTVGGNSSVSGTFNVTGATTLSDDLTVTGETTLGDTLHVNAPGLFSDSVYVAGSAAFGDDVTVTGNSTVGGNSTVSGTLNVTGATTLSNDLTVTGETTLGDTLHVNAPGLFSDSLYVAGSALFGDDVTITGNSTVGGTFGVTGATTLSSSLDALGNTTVGGALQVNGVTTTNDSLLVNNAAVIAGGLSVDSIWSEVLMIAGTNFDSVLTAVNDLSASVSTLQNANTGSLDALEALVDSLAALHAPAPSACDNGSLTYNGTEYNLIEVGGVCWFAEDLQSASYADGTALIQPSSDCGYGADPCWGPYSNPDLMNSYIGYEAGYHYAFGVLENTANGGICPTGWHIANQADWDNLVTEYGGDAAAPSSLLDPTGFAATSNGTSGYTYWDYVSGGAFLNMVDFGTTSYYWLPVEVDVNNATVLKFDGAGTAVTTLSQDRYWGSPIRCVQDAASDASSSLGALQAKVDSLEALHAPTPSACDNGALNYNGTEYDLIEVGGVCWFKEDLQTIAYSDGTELVLPSLDCGFGTEMCWGPHSTPDLIESVVGYELGYHYSFGVLENTSNGGICPTDWHIATQTDWNNLIAEYGGNATAASSLLSPAAFAATTNGVSTYNYDPNSGYGAKLEPFNFGTTAYYWLPLEVDADNGTVLKFDGSGSAVTTLAQDKYYGSAIRCVENASSNAVNNINQFDNVTITGDLVVQNENLMELIAAMQAQIDALGSGASTGPCDDQTTITYHTVDYPIAEYDGRCWFLTDLLTTNLNTGVHLNNSTDNTWINTADPWSIPRTYSYIQNFGSTVIYDYYAVTSDALCPKGWRVPSVDDWNSIADGVGIDAFWSDMSDQAFIFDGDYAAGNTAMGWLIATASDERKPSYGSETGVWPMVSENSGGSVRCVKD